MEDKDVMMASEPVAAYSPTVFDTVISYLHSSHMPLDTKRAVYRQLQAEVADENLAYLKRRLKEISSLKDGWDGYGEAISINPKTIRVMGQFLKCCNSADLEEWRLSPNINGTLLLELDDAAISISSNTLSFYAEKGDNMLTEEGIESTPENISSTVRRINSFMQ
jgi:hypothetical protein